jgi:hypothetical protein
VHWYFAAHTLRGRFVVNSASPDLRASRSERRSSRRPSPAMEEQPDLRVDLGGSWADLSADAPPSTSRPADEDTPGTQLLPSAAAPAPLLPAGLPDRPPFNAFVRNLAYSTARQDLLDFFKAGGAAAKDVRLLSQGDGRPSGTAIVAFPDRESLAAALGLAGRSLNGRSVEVRVDSKTGGGGGSGR